MSPERKRFPEWAGRERESDLHWIRENLPIFAQAARVAYESVGRGAIVVDTTAQPVAGGGHPFGYFSLEQIQDYGDPDIQRMTEGYAPDKELVIVLLKSEERTSTYRVRLQQSGR